MLFSRAAATWTAAVKAPGWVHGVPGKKVSLPQNELLRIKGNQIFF